MKNIKMLLIGLLIFTVGNSTFGQTNKIDIGIEGSPSLTFLRSKYITNKNVTLGFSGGIFFQFNFKKIFSLRTNISYERKGSALNGEATDEYGNSIGKITTHSNFDYLTLPILVRATFGKKVQYFVSTGPYFGYLLKQTFVSKGDIPKTTSDNTSNYKCFDIGISTGLGLSVPIKTKFAISFELRSNLGLYNINAVPTVTKEPIKTNSINFLFGFMYRLGQRTSDAK